MAVRMSSMPVAAHLTNFFDELSSRILPLQGTSAEASVPSVIAENTNLVVVPGSQKAFHVLSSAFGPAPPRNPLEGVIFPISVFNAPMDACSPGNLTAPLVPWAALVQRGGCPFLDKVLTAQTLGAKAVIIGDYNSGRPVLPWSPRDSSQIRIPSVIVTHDAMTQLLDMFWQSQSTNASFKGLVARTEILPSDKYPVQFEAVKIRVLPTVMWAAAIDLLVLFVMVTCSILIYKRKSTFSKINKLPVSIWKLPSASVGSKLDFSPFPSSSETYTFPFPPLCPQEPDSIQKLCPICFSDFELGDYVTRLPCGHVFHAHEIASWLLSSAGSCPVCRAHI